MMPEKVFSYTTTAYGERFADPVQIRRDLLRASGGRLWEWVADARHLQEEIVAAGEPTDNAGKEAMAALQVGLAEQEARLAQSAYQAFGLDPINPNNGHGVGEGEIRRILVQFLEYAEKKE